MYAPKAPHQFGQVVRDAASRDAAADDDGVGLRLPAARQVLRLIPRSVSEIKDDQE